MIKAMNVSMKPYSEAEVLDFISMFGSDREALKGEMNYWFAYILCERFEGVLTYRPVTRAFCALIDGDFYDAGGRIDSVGALANDFCSWEAYRQLERAHSARVLREAILKIPVELVADGEEA